MSDENLTLAGAGAFTLCMALFNTSPDMLAVVARESEKMGSLEYWRGKFKHPVLDNGVRTIAARGPRDGARLAKAIIEDYLIRTA